ncbi:MAG: sigma-70 family RNA polymerase sigma factor [Myxococcota bacterium]
MNPALMNTVDEAALLEQAQQGDARAFEGLVRLHQGRVRACATKMLGAGAEADDAAQETFIRAWKALGRFDGRAKLSTWLYRICTNVCLNRMRRGRRVHADLHDPALKERLADEKNLGPERSALASEMSAQMEAALGRLSPSLRSAVVLVLIEGQSHKQAGDALGVPEGTIAWRIHEARRKLREFLRPAEPQLRKAGS